MRFMDHQIAAMDRFISSGGKHAWYHKVGCGKSVTTLGTFEYLKTLDKDIKSLVICPINNIEGTWVLEVEKHTKLNWHNLYNNKKRFERQPSDIYITNYESFGASKIKFDFIQKLVSSGIWFGILDESSKIKNHDSNTTERILSIKSYFKYRALLSGTPAPNGEYEYWPQMAFLDDDILGNNFYKFRNIYFQLARGKEVAPGSFLNKQAMRELMKTGFKYEINPKMREHMFDRMKKYCHFVDSKDCMDLPDEIDEFKIIEMKDDHLQFYKKMKQDYIIELKNQIKLDDGNMESSFAVANVALTKLLKLRQITSGFVIDEFDNCVKIIENNPKIKALIEIVEECGQDQIIVWGNFRWEIQSIVNVLKEYGGVSQLHGGVKDNERIGNMQDFISGKNRFLVAHPRSAAHGLTFTNAHIQVFFSLSYSYEDYIQMRGRTMRYGQKNNCVYFHLICKNSIDEDILAIVQKKATAVEVARKYLTI